MSVEEAERFFKSEPFVEMDFAKLDLHRKVRSGFPEVIFCQNKPDDYLVSIFERMVKEEGQVFGTRASETQYKLVKEKIPDIQYDPVSRILKLEGIDKQRVGKIAVCCAGTADIPVAEEAAQTAEYFGANIERV